MSLELTKAMQKFISNNWTISIERCMNSNNEQVCSIYASNKGANLLLGKYTETEKAA